MSIIRFGEYLTQLLRERGCSGSRLASMISVDPALVYRWLRNEAVPKLDTPYCDEIARSLHLSQAELSRLKEGQIFSLSKPVEKRSKPHNGGAAVERLLRHAGSQPYFTGAGTSPLPTLSDLAPRPNGIIWGRPAILEATITLLEGLPKLTRHQSETLMLTFQGEEDAFEDFPDLKTQYEQALHNALQRGWRVVHLWRLSRDSYRSITLVQNMLKLLGTGRYFPCYVDHYGILMPPYDLLVAPQAALLFFATQTPRRPDAAMLMRDAEQIELLRTHFYQLSAQSHPLIETFLPDAGQSIWEAFAEAESQPGGRRVVKHGLSCLTDPPSWYQDDSPWMQDIKLTGAARTNMLEQQRQRLAAFRQNVRSYPYRDICPKQAIEELISTGNPPRDDVEEGFRPSIQARREQIHHLIDLLKTCNNYQLALVDASEAARIPTETFWEVAGEHTVFMVTCCPDETGKEILVDLRIKEPTITHALQDYFEDLWESVAPRNKDKNTVIQWLKQQLDQAS